MTDGIGEVREAPDVVRITLLYARAIVLIVSVDAMLKSSTP